MKPNWLRLAPFLVTVALGFAACESGSGPAGPQLAPSTTPLPAVVAEQGCEIGSGIAVTIDKKGGTLKVCQHQLTVPSGAVAKPTVFAMTKTDALIKVELTATSVGSTVLNDVGSKGFAKPLTLTLNYSKATQLPADPSLLRIYWFRPDGKFEEQPSKVNTGNKSVTSNPTHFSQYGVGWPNWCDRGC